MATTQALFSLRSLTPKKLTKLVDVDKLRQRIERAILDTRDDIQTDFGKITATWQHDPAFYQDGHVIYRGQDAKAGVYSDDLPLFFLDEGTSIRHALMSRDFMPKTHRRWIGSARGAGHVLKVSRKIQQPGIEKREFTTAIAEDVQPKLERRVEQAIQDTV